MLSLRRIRKIFYLIMTLVFLLACNFPGWSDEKEGTGDTPQTDSTSSGDMLIYKQYRGEGTFVEVLYLEGTELKCSVPVSVRALIFENGAVNIESSGPCIWDFNTCKLHETDQCLLYGDGTASDLFQGINTDIDMTGCNSGSFTVSDEKVEFDQDHMVGYFVCEMSGGEYKRLDFDISSID